MNLATRVLERWQRRVAGNRVLGFVDEVLRGIGQLMLQNSPFPVSNLD